MKNEISRLVSINRKYGGTVLNRGNLEFGVSQLKRTDNIYRRNARLFRDIVGGHPFTNGNKRTVTDYILSDFERYGYLCDFKAYTLGMERIAKKGVVDVVRIERSLRRWFTKR